jgi:hypothetical protein
LKEGAELPPLPLPPDIEPPPTLPPPTAFKAFADAAVIDAIDKTPPIVFFACNPAWLAGSTRRVKKAIIIS